MVNVLQLSNYLIYLFKTKHAKESRQCSFKDNLYIFEVSWTRLNSHWVNKDIYKSIVSVANTVLKRLTRNIPWAGIWAIR